MHICLATHEFPPVVTGGISTYYSTLAKLLTKGGHRVSVLTIGDASSDEQWQKDRVNVVRLDERIAYFQKLINRFWNPVDTGHFGYFAAVGLAMRGWLREHAVEDQIDVLDIPEYYGTAAFLLELELPPVVVTCHGSVGQVAYHQASDLRSGDQFIASLEQISITSSDEVACYSPSNQVVWREFSGRNPRFVTAPFDVNLIESRPLRSSQSNVFTCVVVARLQSWKGVLETIEALRISRSRGIPLGVQWIGRDTLTAPDSGSMRSYLEREYPDLWGSSFLWTESLPPHDVRRLQLNADFLLIPSRWDTFNFTTVEAMSTGNPVIVSLGAGASYLCRDRENALIVVPGESSGLATSIADLYHDKNLRTALGLAGQQTILEAFEPNRVIQEHLEVYESASNNRAFRRRNPYSRSPLSFILDETGLLTSDNDFLDRFSGRDLLTMALRKLGDKVRRVVAQE